MTMFNIAKRAMQSSILFGLLLLAGCATSGATYSQMQTSQPAVAQGSARIYIYRTAVLGAAIQPTINVDGKAVGDAVPEGFFYVDVPAGDHQISDSTEVTRSVSVTLEAGQTRYVRLDVSMGFFAGHISPTLVDDAEGAKEIQDCHYTGKSG